MEGMRLDEIGTLDKISHHPSVFWRSYSVGHLLSNVTPKCVMD